MADPKAFNSVTSTSIIPLNASGEDPDGALVGIQYYVDGLPYPSADGWIERKKGIPEESQNYPIQLNLK